MPSSDALTTVGSSSAVRSSSSQRSSSSWISGIGRSLFTRLISFDVSCRSAVAAGRGPGCESADPSSVPGYAVHSGAG
ncbi:hypothetical protein ADL15_27235 [Actinoplanes awajinensis subsp. mycoplanecinus]|uniref:Uncharacterized protein n=1 Tax=Actinoplanes awajinensis subsp. mycoplanecinus TaxID=135947 RepID=A0A101JMS7_9ACTN|nr:hypothetical protein ADL15_27235 [Actinoplanes awajinensis subsp. mycoplanecinus]